MIELNNKNSRKYVESVLSKMSEFEGQTLQLVKVVEVTEQTYVNYIFRATLSDGKDKFDIYLRQSRDHIKAAPDKKADASRISYEIKILNMIKEIIPDLVPTVLHLDKNNNVAILSDIKRGCPLLVSELVEGRTHPESGKFFGETLATLHGETYGIANRKVRGSQKKNKDAVDFHLGMRLNPAIKMMPSRVEALLEESSKVRHCLVLGDLASKNIFVDDGKVRFLDLERSFVGDPAFDLAFLFCHYLIEVKPEKIAESLKFIDEFMKAYRKTALSYLSRKQVNRLENRVTRYLGITILYRLFGFYMVVNVERKKNEWTEVAKRLIRETKDTNLPKILNKYTLLNT